MFCFVLPRTDFIAQMPPLLNIMFGSSGHSLSTVNCAPHLSLLLLCSVFLQKCSLCFCLFPSIFHVARCLSVIITHTPPPPLVGKKISVLAAHTCIHACMHAYIHTYIHRYHLFTHTTFLPHIPSSTYFLILHHLLCLSLLPGKDDYQPQGMQKEFAKFAVA